MILREVDPNLPRDVIDISPDGQVGGESRRHYASTNPLVIRGQGLVRGWEEVDELFGMQLSTEF